MLCNHGGTAVMMAAQNSLPITEGGAVRPPHNRSFAKLSRTCARMGAITLLVLLSVPFWVADAGSQKAIDTQRSVLTVHVGKAGMFSGFGHEHIIHAPIQDGTFDEDKGNVEFVVGARTLRVIDSDVSDKDRAEIQSTMVGPKVLDTPQFHEIRFHSTEVSRSGGNRWTVHGNLTFHGQTHPLKVDVEREQGRYRGSARLRQSKFGITPVKVAAGTIKVKDEVRVEFEIVGK
jgi:polyisoprenoid-binding protein YceI